MNPRATGILVLCALALGAFVWLYEIEGEGDRKAAEDAEKRLFVGLEADDLRWIELTTSDGVGVRAERSEGRWNLVVPLLFPADASAWDGIAAALTATTSEASFDDPQAPDVYGLGDGADEVRFASEAAEHALRIGAAAPVGGNTYAAVGGADPVHTIATWRATSLRKEFAALRDKRLLDFDAGTVTRLVAEWPDGRVALDRDAETWQMQAPVAGPGDAEVIRELLSNLSFLRAEAFEDAPPGDVEAGLDPPAYSIALTLVDESDSASESSRVVRLAVGSPRPDGTRLARAGQASLYRIAGARLDDLPREVAAYRYKQLADFSVDAAQRVELVFRGDDGEPVEIVATRGDPDWSSEPEAIPAVKLAALVRELSSLTAETILAERVGPDELAGLELAPPLAAFTVRADTDDAPLAEVRFGAVQGGDGFVAQSGENPQLFRLPIELSEQLPLSLEALRNHFLAAGDETDDEPDEAEPEIDLESLGFDSESLQDLLEGARQAP